MSIQSCLKLSLFAAFFVMFFAGSLVHAQQNVADLLTKPMPVFDAMPLEDFKSKSRVFKDIPLGDSYLEYEVSLPEGWEKSQNQSISGFSLNKKILADLGRYFGPANLSTRSVLTIKASEREFESTAEQWLLNYVLENGYTVQGLKSYTPTRAEAVYIVVEGDQTLIVRTVVVTNGKRVVLAEYTLPSDEWHNEKALQARVLESFNLLKDDTGLVEEMGQSQFLDIAEMQYPVSWDLQTTDVRSIDRLDASLLRVAQRLKGRETVQILNGKIDIYLISSFVVDDLEKETLDFKARIKETGLVLGEIIEEPEELVVHDKMEFAYTEVYYAVDPAKPNINYEFWFTIMAAKDYYYFTTLLTPARDQDFANWSRNAQTYRLVNRFLKPQENVAPKR